MEGERDKTKRWSVWTLIVLVMMVCVCLACWGSTKKYGVYDLHGLMQKRRTADIDNPVSTSSISVAIPFVIGVDETRGSDYCRCYYFWFFGYVKQLPFLLRPTVRPSSTPPRVVGSGQN